MNNLTILIVGTDMMNIYNHRVELIQKLLSLGYGVTVVAPAGGEERTLVEMGVKFIDTSVDNRGTNIRNDFKLLMSIIRIIKREKPDAVLTFYTKTNIYGGLACRITGTPYIENITGLGTAVSKGGIMQKLMIRLYGMAVKKASMVFFQNTSNRQFFADHHISVKNDRLLPGSGVSLDRFKPLEYPAGGHHEFVFISRVIKEKGIEEYVEAARRIKQRYPDTVFHVIGPSKSEEYKKYLENAATQGIVAYHGKLFDVVPYLKNCHCTVFPSYYAEGIANVLLESAASARPVITTGLPGCGETVDDGVTGFIVTEKDSQDLYEKIERFINMPHEEKVEMGIRSREKMEREFNREIVIDAYVEEIEKICSK